MGTRRQLRGKLLNVVLRLMVHVKYIASRGNRSLWAMPTNPRKQAFWDLEPDSNKGLHSLNHDQFEEVAIQTLSPYSTQHDWGTVVSCPNEHGQTLAHFAVTLGYPHLLEQLIAWKIDLSARDAMGATALQLAYLYNRPDCVSLLTQNGGDQQVCDEPDESGVTFSGMRDKSSDLAPEHVGSTKTREERLGTERVLVPKEESGFDPRQTNISECGTNSLGLAGLDLSTRSPTTGAMETGTVKVQPPGPSAQSRGTTLPR